jgi:hypothetical protein
MGGLRMTVFALVIAAAATGCAGDGDGDRRAAEPGSTPQVASTPALTPAPPGRGARNVQGQGFSIAIDPAFTQRVRTASNGQPVIVLSRPSDVPGLNTGVSVFREPDPKADVVEQSHTLEQARRTLTKATDLERTEVAWPGSQKAVLVRWTQQAAGPGGTTVPVRYWQLNTQISPALILIVVGFSPASSFDTSGVAEAVSSFRPQGA